MNAITLLTACIVLETARELCFKLGVSADERNNEDKAMLRTVLTTPWLMLGIGLWCIEMIAWIAALETVPLNIAFPVVSLVYAGVPIASRLLLNERMYWRQWIAAAIIVGGVALVGASGV
ncbi:MAG: EamA family transporter [Pseudomonadota bacterium]|nr:EamA family transporter [Pseudomonadota bacterium]MDE3037531.1 EamA family transporter [Pseudomonadota bacterium]